MSSPLELCPGGPVLRGAALHEICGADGDAEDAALPAGFAAWAAARACMEDAGGRGVLWAAVRADLCLPGLMGFGITPARLLVAEGGTDRDVLQAMEDGLRGQACAAVVGEVGALDLTASRRLQLAAAASGALALVLRRARDPARARAGPTAAWSRWRVTALPSTGGGPLRRIGRPRWRLDCLRVRGGVPAAYEVDVDDAAIPFTLSARLAADLRAEAPAPHAGHRRAG